jgi:hypothetical protein
MGVIGMGLAPTIGAVRIGGAASDSHFFMSTVPAMPQIRLTAELVGFPPNTAAAFTWTFALDYAEYLVTRAGQRRFNVRTKSHPPIAPRTGLSVIVPLTTVMCGRLTVTLTATVGTRQLTATRRDILVGGSNPSSAELSSLIPDELVRKMVTQESGRKQFSDVAARAYVAQAINPNWSSDNLRGVGLGQLTNPPPGDGDIWNWRTNAASLQSRFAGMVRSAGRFAGRILASQRLGTEVTALNAWRGAEGQPALTVTAPALTAEQSRLEACRAYNGFGPQVVGQYLPHVHEFEPAVRRYTSATRRGSDGAPLVSLPLLDVTADGAIRWVQISGADRLIRYGGRPSGEPNYVALVQAQTA